MPLLDVWYAHLDVEEAVAKLESQLAKRGRKLTEKAVAKARTRDSLQALASSPPSWTDNAGSPATHP